MFDYFKAKFKKPKVFEDDDQFASIYDLISKADINFDTHDNKSFTARVGDKLWLHASYSTWSDEVTLNAYVRVITDPVPEGKALYNVSVETNFSKDNVKRLEKLLDVKVEGWRVKNLDAVEAKRKEKMKNVLNS